MKKVIKAVIFDMDGVIFNSEEYARLSLEDAFKELNMPFSDEYYAGMLGATNDQAIQNGARLFGSLELSIKLSECLLKHLHDYYMQGKVNFLPGAIELINYLNENNFPIALATSGSLEKIKMAFAKQNVDPIPFKYIVYDKMVKKCKPDPEVFIKASKMLNVDIKNCLVIEDSYNGMNAAFNCSSISCMVPDRVPPTEDIIKRADYIKKDLFEVKEMLKEYVNP